MKSNLYKRIEAYKPYDEHERIDKEIILKFMEEHDDYLTRNNKIAHFTTSAWIVNKERTKVLMIYHNIYQSWAWVGGHADGEEDLFQVIKREIEEETGLKNIIPLQDTIYGINIITVDNHIKKGKYVASHLHFDVEYLFETEEDEKLRIKEDENSAVGWIELEKVKEYSKEAKMKPIYERLTHKLKEKEKETF